MLTSKINKVRRFTKNSNSVLYRAGEKIMKDSFSTAGKLAQLYKDAGVKGFHLSKDVVKKTIRLSVDNQKEIIKTSGSAIKEILQNIRSNVPVVEDAKKGTSKKNGQSKKRVKSKKDITIDDLLVDN